MKVKLDNCRHMAREIAEVIFKNGTKHLRESCVDCGAYIKFVPRPTPESVEKLEEVIMAFGKYAGENLIYIFRNDPGYLFWLSEQDFYEGRCAKRLLDLTDSSGCDHNFEAIGQIVKRVTSKLPKDRV